VVSDALKRLIREQKIRTDAALAEREATRLAEVRAAFYEGMAAGSDAYWQERPPDDYWLESAARRSLYAGPPVPIELPSRAALFRKLGRHARGYRYNPFRDPGRVLGGSGPHKGKRRT
jgi:hypothetical protein